MATPTVTITQQTGGSFLFEPSVGKKRSCTRPLADQIGDNIDFYNNFGKYMIPNVPYTSITTVIAAVTKSDYASAEEVIDALYAAGFSMPVTPPAP